MELRVSWRTDCLSAGQAILCSLFRWYVSTTSLQTNTPWSSRIRFTSWQIIFQIKFVGILRIYATTRHVNSSLQILRLIFSKDFTSLYCFWYQSHCPLICQRNAWWSLQIMKFLIRWFFVLLQPSYVSTFCLERETSTTRIRFSSPFIV